ncbi:SWIM zinc finger family protein [Pannus brasiliensis CCIBt3594]|uniref:SWIM zinc finger family protein n=1 Tax=Pannus brasiliensis CCIBt3594 TaxID=1427578 RepID=A0AAW9QJS0_9CHRO
MTIPPIDENAIRGNATDSSWQRGQEYYREKAVISLGQRGESLEALVRGSEWKPYRVRIDFSDNEIDLADCNCPYDYGGWCKHIVATLLAASRQPERVQEKASLKELITPLNEEQIRGLIAELVAESPELMDTIERYARRFVTPPAKASPATDATKVTVNPASYRQKVRYLLKDAVRNAESEYWEEDIVPSELFDLIEEALEYLDRGEGHNALAIIEAIVTTCGEEWDEIEEYGGDSGDIGAELDDALTRTILSTELSPEERLKLQEKINEWRDEWRPGFEMSLEALRQGWDHPPLVRILQGEIPPSEAIEGSPPYFAEELTDIRLEILESRDLDTEYLNLAKATGKVISYLTKLIYLDRIPEAMTEADTTITTAEEAYFVAKALRDEGAPENALTLARRGLTLPPETSAGRFRELAVWTSELAESLNEMDTALGARIKAFQRAPSIEDYRKLQNLAGEDWDDLKPDLLDFLRDSDGWRISDEKIKIFLLEELVEDAIATVSRYSGISGTLVHQVLDAAAGVNPDWVIDRARPPAESIIDAKKADRYHEAIGWLKHVREAYYRSGRQAEWQTYRERLLQEHGRKPKFVGLFKPLT